jgi:hypothetical protein
LQSLVHPNTWQVLCEASVGKASLDSVTTMLFREERSAGR